MKSAKWDFGDGTIIVTTWQGAYPHIFASGTYEVTLIADNDSAHALKKKITIKPFYSFSQTGSAVAGDTLYFTPYSYPAMGNTYYWTFGDGAASTDAEPYHIYTNTGNYKVRLVVNGDEPNNVVKTITIGKDPLYTYKVAGKKIFRECKLVTRPAGAPAFTTMFPDSLIEIVYIDKLNLSINGEICLFSPDKSGGSVICFEKVFGGSQTINIIAPGSITYNIADDRIDISNVTNGTTKAGASGNVFDYTFTCHAP